MPNHEGRFHLYSDTSKFVADSALYQIQNGKPRLIVHTPVKDYQKQLEVILITELELCGLVINIASFFTLIEESRCSMQ